MLQGLHKLKCGAGNPLISQTSVPLVHHGAQCRLVVHNIVLYCWCSTQCSSHKPTLTDLSEIDIDELFQLRTGKSTMLLLLIGYLLLNTRCEVPDATKALTFILSSTVVNAMVNDHVKAIKEWPMSWTLRRGNYVWVTFPWKCTCTERKKNRLSATSPCSPACLKSN